MFFNDAATTEIYTLSLHDALPIFLERVSISLGETLIEPHAPIQYAHFVEHGILSVVAHPGTVRPIEVGMRSEEHTSELQSRQYLVCRLLLEKKTKPPQIGVIQSSQ